MARRYTSEHPASSEPHRRAPLPPSVPREPRQPDSYRYDSYRRPPRTLSHPPRARSPSFEDGLSFSRGPASIPIKRAASRISDERSRKQSRRDSPSTALEVAPTDPRSPRRSSEAPSDPSKSRRGSPPGDDEDGTNYEPSMTVHALPKVVGSTLTAKHQHTTSNTPSPADDHEVVASAEDVTLTDALSSVFTIFLRSVELQHEKTQADDQLQAIQKRGNTKMYDKGLALWNQQHSNAKTSVVSKATELGQNTQLVQQSISKVVSLFTSDHHQVQLLKQKYEDSLSNNFALHGRNAELIGQKAVLETRLKDSKSAVSRFEERIKALQSDFKEESIASRNFRDKIASVEGRMESLDDLTKRLEPLPESIRHLTDHWESVLSKQRILSDEIAEAMQSGNTAMSKIADVTSRLDQFDTEQKEKEKTVHEQIAVLETDKLPGIPRKADKKLAMELGNFRSEVKEADVDHHKQFDAVHKQVGELRQGAAKQSETHQKIIDHMAQNFQTERRDYRQSIKGQIDALHSSSTWCEDQIYWLQPSVQVLLQALGFNVATSRSLPSSPSATLGYSSMPQPLTGRPSTSEVVNPMQSKSTKRASAFITQAAGFDFASNSNTNDNPRKYSHRVAVPNLSPGPPSSTHQLQPATNTMQDVVDRNTATIIDKGQRQQVGGQHELLSRTHFTNGQPEPVPYQQQRQPNHGQHLQPNHGQHLQPNHGQHLQPLASLSPGLTYQHAASVADVQPSHSGSHRHHVAHPQSQYPPPQPPSNPLQIQSHSHHHGSLSGLSQHVKEYTNPNGDELTNAVQKNPIDAIISCIRTTRGLELMAARQSKYECGLAEHLKSLDSKVTGADDERLMQLEAWLPRAEEAEKITKEHLQRIDASIASLGEDGIGECTKHLKALEEQIAAGSTSLTDLQKEVVQIDADYKNARCSELERYNRLMLDLTKLCDMMAEVQAALALREEGDGRDDGNSSAGR